MPELPEVEIVRLGLHDRIIGETIDKIEILREQSIAHPSAKSFAKSLMGKTFTDVTRRGKYLFLYLTDAVLVVHLRMSGRLLLLENTSAEFANSANSARSARSAPSTRSAPSARSASTTSTRFLRVRFSLRNKQSLCFDDMRVFGRLWYFSRAQDLYKIIPSLAKLGLEPLDSLTAKQLLVLFVKRRKAIKTVLLDQNVLAGIGNIYADEILFQAGIHPLTPAEKINDKQAKELAKIIPLTLNRAIKLGGSSIKNFVDTSGVNGNYQHESLVYGRTNKPCRICYTKIERIKIGGRSAHFCPVCQKMGGKKL